MSAVHLVVLALVPLIIAVGQVLFKIVSTGPADGRGMSAMLIYAGDWRLWLALLLYGAATIAWLAAIRRIPINQAYMFMALSYVYLPVIAWAMLGERYSYSQAAGLALILAGLYFSMTARSA
jgi:undecaprenyl phosphate-alpha-L-ara4N flippase subunit ArnE